MWWNLEVQPTSNYSLRMALQVYIKIRSCWPTWRPGSYSLEIGHTGLFGFQRICSLGWTQKVLQAMGIVFPCQPLLLRVWLEISTWYRAWRIKIRRFRESKLPYKVCHVLLKVKDGHLTILTNCPFLSFWPELSNSKDQICDGLCGNSNI